MPDVVAMEHMSMPTAQAITAQKGASPHARVAPITGKSDVPAEYHDVVDGVLQVFGQVRGPFSMLLHSPKLAERVLNLGNFFRSNDSVVAAKDRSLASSSPHVSARAPMCGRPRSRRRAAPGCVRKPSISSAPREIRRSFPRRARYRGLRPATGPEEPYRPAAFDALKQKHDVQWAGRADGGHNYYGFLSGVVSAFEVPPPPDGDKLPT